MNSQYAPAVLLLGFGRKECPLRLGLSKQMFELVPGKEGAT